MERSKINWFNQYVKGSAISISVEWLDEQQRILVFRLISPWTMQQMYQAVADGEIMSENLADEFYIVFDIRESKGFPKDFLSSLSYLTQHKQENVARRVVVGTNIIFRATYQIVRQLAPHLAENFAFLNTMDEAVEYIQTLQK